MNGRPVEVEDNAEARWCSSFKQARPLAVDLVPEGLRSSWFYRLAERRFGKWVADLLSLGKQRQIAESLRQQQAQPVKHIPNLEIGM